jgi:hypothetical protein
MTETCAWCWATPLPGVILRRCGSCLELAYCDRVCQRAHYAIHKTQCEAGRVTPMPEPTQTWPGAFVHPIWAAEPTRELPAYEPPFLAYFRASHGTQPGPFYYLETRESDGSFVFGARDEKG